MNAPRSMCRSDGKLLHSFRPASGLLVISRRLARLTIPVYARQFVEIALANLIINPTSNKVQQKFSGSKPGQASGQGATVKPGSSGRLGRR